MFNVLSFSQLKWAMSTFYSMLNGKLGVAKHLTAFTILNRIISQDFVLVPVLQAIFFSLFKYSVHLKIYTDIKAIFDFHLLIIWKQTNVSV